MASYINVNGTDRKVAPTKVVLYVDWAEGLQDVKSSRLAYPQCVVQLEDGVQADASVLNFSAAELVVDMANLEGYTAETLAAIAKINEGISYLFDNGLVKNDP